jgi:hypothetical protein
MRLVLGKDEKKRAVTLKLAQSSIIMTSGVNPSSQNWIVYLMRLVVTWKCNELAWQANVEVPRLLFRLVTLFFAMKGLSRSISRAASATDMTT